MSAPTIAARKTVLRRDLERCISCAEGSELTFRVRAENGPVASPPPGAVAMCRTCGRGCTAEMAVRAATYGWVIGQRMDPTLVPVYYPHEFQWFLLTGETRRPISSEVAVELMCAAHGNAWVRWWEEVIYG
jgi:hypothetical protein